MTQHQMNIKTLDLRFNSNLDYDYAVLYDTIAKNIRQEFTKFIEKLSKGFKSNIDWWVANPSSRHCHFSPLFHYCCTFLLLRELIDKRNTVVEEIIVDSPAFRDILARYLRNKQSTTRISLRQSKYRLIKKLAIIMYVTISLIVPFIYIRLFHFSKKPIRFNSPIILIDTFIIPGFEKIDRYYTGLWESLNTLERKSIYFVPTLIGFSLMQVIPTYYRLLKSEKNYLIKEDFLKVKDYLYTLGHVLRILRLNLPKAIFSNTDFSELIREEIYALRNMNSSFIALLNYRFFFRLKQNEIPIMHTIDWFENQLVDKGWNAGVRTFYPESESTGYLGNINFCHTFISIFPTNYEESAKVLPKNFAVIGQGYTEIIKEYLPDLHVKVVPALRFQGVWKKRKRFPDPSKFTVMIALDGEGIEYDIACLHQVYSCLPFLKEYNWCFWVKPHPITPEVKIRMAFGELWPDKFVFVKGDFNELVEQADVLFSNGMTSTCLEAIMKGVPVIVLGKRNGLTFISIPDSIPRNTWRLCYTMEEIIEALRFFYKQSTDIKSQNCLFGEEMRLKYVEPVTKKGIKQFLRLDCE
jgi:hypothetical protein|tara:strand:+ start:6332 stop:8071 length:1740 start_codon:yes stop_codon:yes gene_type:complete